MVRPSVSAFVEVGPAFALPGSDRRFIPLYGLRYEQRDTVTKRMIRLTWAGWYNTPNSS